MKMMLRNLVTSLTVLIIVVSATSGFAARRKRYFEKHLFHIPWACSVLHSEELVSACAIIDWDKVIVSVDNFCMPVPNSSPPKKYFQVVNEVHVFAGTNYMDPRKLGTEIRYVQTHQATTLYVAFKSPNVLMDGNIVGSWEVHSNPAEISPNVGVEYTGDELTFGAGVLLIKGKFHENPYVMRMLIIGPDIGGRASVYKFNLEHNLRQGTQTCTTYSWNKKLNRIRYHQVTYQPDTACTEVFCNWRLSSCRLIPRRDEHMCYRSVRYEDVCPSGRGAALYCPGFEKSVLAILTSSPSCGQRDVPGVYTMIDRVIDFMDHALNSNFDSGNVQPYDPYKLPQWEDYTGIL